MAHQLLRLVQNPGSADCNCIQNVCCDCWTNGCGLNACFGKIADGLEVINPVMEWCADAIWIFGSPLAFPLIFCFDSGPETQPPGGGWTISMLSAPCKAPFKCCFYTICAPCGQWSMRRQLLDYDMTKYKLWQGYHDGPHCFARRCPGAPCTIESGTYGEEKCPNCFLCLEVWLLAGMWSVCCAFNVNRRMIKEQRKLGNDPTENRMNKCVGFFSHLAQQCCMLGCCVGITACCVGCCAPDSAGAQECSGEAGRAGHQCRRCAMTCWRGIWSIKIIAQGCMTAQMDVELKEGQPLVEAPKVVRMDRGGPADDDAAETKWWFKEEPESPSQEPTAPVDTASSQQQQQHQQKKKNHPKNRQ